MKRGAPLLIAGLLAAGCATDLGPLQVEGPLDWNCRGEHRAAEGTLWINRTLAPDGAFRRDFAGWRARRPDRSLTLFWDVPGGGAWHGNPQSMELDFALPRTPRGAVWAFLYADGRLVAQQEAVDRRLARRLAPESRVGGSFFFHRDRAPPVPVLHGVSELRLLAVGDDGARLADLVFPLPDWGWADRWMAEAMTVLAAEAADFRHRCEAAHPPIIH